MAQDGGGQDLMGYEALAQEALRGVVKAALKRAAGPGGVPGAHHFYISFKTQAPGVSIPPDLVEKYPDEMTIVLQHQFWDLAPGETFFSITLRFGGQPKRLALPYGAVTRFYDPSVQFLLQFEPNVEAHPQPASPAELVSLRPRKDLATEPKALPAPKKPAEAKKPPRAVEPPTPPGGDASPPGDGAKSDGPKSDGPKSDGPKSDGPKSDGPKIVSLDKFRKK